MTDREAMLALAAPPPDDGLSPEWQAWNDKKNAAYRHAWSVEESVRRAKWGGHVLNSTP